jgi:glycosyltransferase involved in cell wall biosynthesis
LRSSNATRKPRTLKTIQVPRRFVKEAWGGTECMILESSRALKDMGHQASVFTSLALSSQKKENILGVQVKRFSYNYPFLGLSADQKADMDRKGGNLLSLSLFAGLLFEPGVDLLHAHTGKRLGGIVRSVAKLRRIPYVISLHGGVFDVPSSEAESLLTPIEGKFEWGRIFGAIFGSRRVLEDASAILCVGRSEYEAAKKQLPGKRVEFMPNGVDSARFKSGDGARFRQRHGLSNDAKIILCVSRIDPQKDQLTLIKALPEISEHEPRSHLVLIGPVTRPEYLKAIEQTISELGLEEKVTIIPGLAPDDPELLDAYKAASLFCLPSMHEPFGIVILEAWAAGLPVVASRVGGIPGFVVDGSDALLFETGNTKELATKVGLLLVSRIQSHNLAQAGQTRARIEFDWKVIARKLESLYQELVTGAR